MNKINLKSEDIILVLYRLVFDPIDHEYETDYIYNNQISEQEILRFLENKHEEPVEILHIARG